MSFKIVGIGEILWDLLPSGRQMGGAPANFAYHARALGADARVVSRVGDDDLGREIIQRLETLEVPTYCVFVDRVKPTGTVTVRLADDGQPQFTIHEDVAWDNIQADSAALLATAGADAICFGSLAQRCEPSRSNIRAMINGAPKGALRVFDINLRRPFYSSELIEQSLAMANVLKLNDTELPVVAGFLHLTGSPEEQVAQLAKRFELRLVAYTRGARGSLLFGGGRSSDHAGLSQQITVKDTVGAGDAFTAAVTLGLLAGWDLDKINRLANEVAAYVCTCSGATPPMPAHLRCHFQSSLLER
jgi:fructokinase